jgi:hypothetical protein
MMRAPRLGEIRRATYRMADGSVERGTAQYLRDHWVFTPLSLPSMWWRVAEDDLNLQFVYYYGLV